MDTWHFVSVTYNSKVYKVVQFYTGTFYLYTFEFIHRIGYFNIPVTVEKKFVHLLLKPVWGAIFVLSAEKETKNFKKILLEATVWRFANIFIRA